MDPQAALQDLLRDAPVFYHPPLDAYYVLPYAEVREVFGDDETYSSVAYKAMPVRPALRDRIPEEWERVGQVIQGGQTINMDAPAHTVQRRALQRTFTHRRVDHHRPVIAGICDAFIDEIAERGACDLMQDFASRLTLAVTASMLNVPDDMLPGFSAWINDVFGILAPIDLDPEDVTTPDDDLVATYERLYGAYLTYSEFLAQRRANPGEDLASAMLTLTDDEGRPALTEDEVLGHMVGITAAGTDTTANLIVNMVRYFTEDPEQLQLVLDEPALWDNAIEEGLRRSAVSPQLLRIARRESEILGMAIPDGSTVALSVPAANADPRKFPDPLRFDVRRPNAGDHLAFGRGRHFCLGSPLARPEARIALETLYRRLPGLAADLDQELRFIPALGVRGIVSQNVTWEA
jgi:cytochrome P450